MDDCLSQYKALTIDQFDLVNQYLALVDYRLSRYNFINLWMYTKWIPIYYYLENDILMLSTYYRDHYFSYLPLCKKEKLEEAFTMIEQQYQICNLPFIYAGFEERYADMIMVKHPDFEKRAYRASFDYVYEIERFRSFSGKKLQKKRNHLNAFYQAHPDFQYQAIAENNIAEIKEFVKGWYSDKSAMFLDHDEEANNEVLNNYAKLQAKGGCILIDGKIEGFIIASELQEDTMQVNIEKANSSIRGIYQALLREFLQREFLQAKYMNREDDLGLENLRKAKLSYNPDFLIENFRICKKDHHVDYET